MDRSNQNHRWLQALLLSAAVGVAGLAAAGPAAADYRRSCHFVVEAVPTGAGLEDVLYAFRAFNTVRYLTQVNDARRDIRARVSDCVRGHWIDATTTTPYACEDSGRIEMGEYPFADIREEIRLDICAANRDQVRLPVNIDMWIRGERGCLEYDEDRGVDPVAHVGIASGFEITCPISDAGGWERVDPEPIPDAGGWERVDPAPTTPPLPNTRLPGMDIGVLPAADWQACWTLCEDNDACRAWTFRATGTSGPGSPALCLLKSGAALQVPDGCCQSGIKD